MSSTSLSPKNIERSQRLDKFLQERADQIMTFRADNAEDDMTLMDDKIKSLDNFMDTVTDKAIVENAKAAWENKT
jgi:hypothetical protein